MNNPELVIIIVGSLVGISCALVGSFLVLRKMSLIGDAISHAVLPGIAIAFFIAKSRAPIIMLIGAGAIGLLTVLLIESLIKTRRVASDASIGVVFPALFALGVILISKFAAQIDLDLDCVLYGEIAYTPLDTLIVSGSEIGPKAIWVLGGTTILNLLFVTLFYKELKISTFDPGLAESSGFSPTLMHYLLMSLVSITTVASFESVGAILVVAMLIVPAAAAYLITDNLAFMILIASLIGILSSFFGYKIAHTYDASIAGAMAASVGIIFLLAWAFAPKHGLVARFVKHKQMARRVAQRLLLGHLVSIEKRPSLDDLLNRFRWKRSFANLVIKRLFKKQLIKIEGDRITLTTLGRAQAQKFKVVVGDKK